MLLSVYISRQAIKKRPQQITSHYVIYKGSCKLNNKCVVKEKVALKLLKVSHRCSAFHKVRIFTGMVEKRADASLGGLEDVIHSLNGDLWLKNG